MATPITETFSWDAVASTTIANYRPTMHDNIFNDLVVLFWLRMNDKKRMVDGGTRIEETLMYEKNSTAKNYSDYDVLDTTPQDGITKAFYDWKQVAASISISRMEERKNSGKHAIMSLIGSKTVQAELTIKDLLNQQLIGDASSATEENWGGDTAGFEKYFRGIANFVQSDPTASHVVGGINQSTETWWQNQYLDSTVGVWSTNNAGLAEMRTMYNLCSKGNDHPDFLLCDQYTFEEYEAMIAGNLRYLDTRFGDAGFVNLTFKNATVTYDEWFASMSTAQLANAGGAGNGLGRMYFLNSKYISFVVDTQTDLIHSEFVRPANQDAKTSQIMLYGELTSGNRRRLGVIFGITDH